MELERILLFNEMRKDQISNQDVRLIEIEGRNVAACALEHASSLQECEFFLVTRMARAEGDLGYEIDFVVQTQTKKASLSFS
jgi:Ser-tRNA(Ala) deacylase AlaX